MDKHGHIDLGEVHGDEGDAPAQAAAQVNGVKRPGCRSSKPSSRGSVAGLQRVRVNRRSLRGLQTSRTISRSLSSSRTSTTIDTAGTPAPAGSCSPCRGWPQLDPSAKDTIQQAAVTARVKANAKQEVDLWQTNNGP